MLMCVAQIYMSSLREGKNQHGLSQFETTPLKRKFRIDVKDGKNLR